MIRKIFFVAFCLFTLYSIFVARFSPKWWSASQHQWQDNIIKAQKLLYDKSDTIQNVIVGSSLSCKLNTDSLPKTYNLSFAGQGIFDGLNILKRNSKQPKNLFIEMNVIERFENREFDKSINSPFMYYARKLLVSLQEDKQPIAVLGKISIDALQKIKNTVLHSKVDPKKESGADKSFDSGTFSRLLAVQTADYEKELDKETIDKSFKVLKDYVETAEKKGINVIFFEMPVNAKLENLPKAKIIREAFYQCFSPSKYKYIPIPSSVKYETIDGIHLNEMEAAQYTGYFKSAITYYLH